MDRIQQRLNNRIGELSHNATFPGLRLESRRSAVRQLGQLAATGAGLGSVRDAARAALYGVALVAPDARGGAQIPELAAAELVALVNRASDRTAVLQGRSALCPSTQGEPMMTVLGVLSRGTDLRSVAMLKKMVGHAQDPYREAALVALAKHAHPKAREVLVSVALRDVNPSTRIAALKTLVLHQCAAAQTAVWLALESDTSEEVRIAAQQLVRIG